MGFNYVNPRDLKKKVTHYSSSETIPQSSKDVRAKSFVSTEKKQRKDRLSQLKFQYIGKYVRKRSWFRQDEFILCIIQDVILDSWGSTVLSVSDVKGNVFNLDLEYNSEFYTQADIEKMRRKSLTKISI